MERELRDRVKKLYQAIIKHRPNFDPDQTHYTLKIFEIFMRPLEL